MGADLYLLGLHQPPCCLRPVDLVSVCLFVFHQVCHQPLTAAGSTLLAQMV